MATLPPEMRTTIKGCSAALGGTGLFSAFFGPGADLAVIAPTWVGMTTALAVQAGHEMDNNTAKKLCTALAAGLGTFYVGTKAATTFFAWTGIGTIPAMIANASVNAGLTYKVGVAMGQVFLEADDLSSIDYLVSAIVALVVGDSG